MEDQDWDNRKSIKHSMEEYLQIFQTALNEGDDLTLLSAKDAVATSKAQLVSAIYLVKTVIKKTNPPVSQPGNTTRPQRSIEIKSKNFLYISKTL